ncbi:MAG: zinc ribbon domain-containing protein [Ardenticatenales bacterium]|nr:zinc ribbon domain-containing protein [Ardenticatenales bacterium]
MDAIVEQLGTALRAALVFLGAFGLALWLSTAIWVFRDIRARTRDIFAVLLALLLVLLLPFAGMLLYLLLRPRETLAEQYERSLEEEALLQEIEERNVCPACHESVEDDFLLCPNCSTRLKNRCTNCTRMMKLDWNICPYCGT